MAHEESPAMAGQGPVADQIIFTVHGNDSSEKFLLWLFTRKAKDSCGFLRGYRTNGSLAVNVKRYNKRISPGAGNRPANPVDRKVALFYLSCRQIGAGEAILASP